MQFAWSKLPRPILALAPMSGYTDSAFRQVVKEVAPQTICFTEFISADAIAHGNAHSQEKFSFVPAEQPLIVQIFGPRPQALAEAARKIEASGAAGIDINMGCPARKVLRSGSGASLVKDWSTAQKIVSAVRKAVKLPVSVKTRIGWDKPDDALQFTKLLVEAGAEMLTIHGRVATEGHIGEVHWEAIYELKKVLPVPVLGNGGINTWTDIKAKLGVLDGVMVGRAALDNPWLFAGKDLAEVPWPERVRLYRRQAELTFALKGEQGIIALRKHLMHYVSGTKGAKKYRARFSQVETLADIETALADLG